MARGGRHPQRMGPRGRQRQQVRIEKHEVDLPGQRVPSVLTSGDWGADLPPTPAGAAHRAGADRASPWPALPGASVWGHCARHRAAPPSVPPPGTRGARKAEAVTGGAGPLGGRSGALRFHLGFCLQLPGHTLRKVSRPEPSPRPPPGPRPPHPCPSPHGAPWPEPHPFQGPSHRPPCGPSSLTSTTPSP